MNSTTIRIVFSYVIAGLLWISISDILFITIEGRRDHPILVMGSISAGLFIVVTSFILHKLISVHFSRLQDSEKQYRSYFEDNPIPMWIYNRSTLKFTEVNDAALANYGYSEDEFSKMTILDIRPKEDADKVRLAVKTFESSYKDSGTWHHKRKDQSDIFVQITSHLTYLNGTQQVMIMAKDITKRLQTEKQLTDANAELIKRNTILREIAWAQSHDVRKPLASIMGLLNVLKNAESEPEKELCINYIEISAQELDIMIYKMNQQINEAVFLDEA